MCIRDSRLAYAGGRYLAYKPAAICCSARRAGTTSTLDQLVKYPEFFHMLLVSGSYWPMVHGSNPEQVLQDAEGLSLIHILCVADRRPHRGGPRDDPHRDDFAAGRHRGQRHACLLSTSRCV